MRRLAMLLWLAWMAIPAFGAKPVKVHELEDAVQSARGFSDGKLARKISGMELTERLSEARFELLYAGLPGARSRHALMQLADMAAFLDPPAEDVAARPMPPMTEQVNILLRTVDYEKEMLPKLPNFFATRDVQRFLELKPVGMHGEDVTTIYDRLHPFDKAQDIVLYRDGKEVVDSGGKKRKHYDKAEGLTTHGVFGPILGVVLTDATHGNLKWGHWEEGTDGPVAVFDFHVVKEKSHYQVTFCCFTSMSGMQEEFKQYTAYHGEMAIDPASGAILRLSILADMAAADPVRKSGILVDYGRVEIGGGMYVCPTRSVSLLVASKEGAGVQETTLNDTIYSEYHRFGTESRILTDVPEEAH
jgi:hypothetical protein